MNQYLVKYEARPRGGIGIFEPAIVRVDMFQSSYSEAEIYRDAMNQLHILQNMETRFPLSMEKVTK